MKQVDKKELCNLLGIGKDSLKLIIKRKQLEERLKKKGYLLLGQEKKGRNMYYNIEVYNVDVEIYSSLIKNHYSTDKQDEFGKYFNKRKEASYNDKALSKRDLSNLAGVSYQTISKWDKISVNEDVFKKNGYCYFKYIAKTGEIIETNWEEFSNFWKSKKISNRMEQYFKELKEGKITLETYNLLVVLTAGDRAVEEGVVYYRVQCYKVNDKNKLCSTISKLIKNIYGF